MLDMWPFFLLIAVFVGFSIYMARTMGSGSDGSYTALMKRQNELIEAQIAAQMQMQERHLATNERSAAAMERIAAALERRGE